MQGLRLQGLSALGPLQTAAQEGGGALSGRLRVRAPTRAPPAEGNTATGFRTDPRVSNSAGLAAGDSEFACGKFPDEAGAAGHGPRVGSPWWEGTVVRASGMAAASHAQ